MISTGTPSARRPFFSLKWKAFVYTSTLLTLIFLVFHWGAGYYLQSRFDRQLKQDTQHLVMQSDALIALSAQHIQQLAMLFGQLEGLSDALAAGDTPRLQQVFEDYWFPLEMDAGLRHAALFRADDQIRLWVGSPHIPPQLISALRTTTAPVHQVVCYQRCDLYVAVPLRLPGDEDGMLVFGADLGVLLADFQALSDADLAVLLNRDALIDGGDFFVPAWGAEVLAISHAEQNTAVLKAAAQRLDRGELEQGALFAHGDRMLHLVLRPLAEAQHPRPGELMFLQDVTDAFDSMQQGIRNSMVFGIGTLLAAELLLLAVLWTPMQRLRRITRELPRLASEDVGQVRDALKGFDRQLVFADESDALYESALQLSVRLDTFQQQLTDRADLLAARTHDLEAEKQFVTSLLDTAHAIILTQNDLGRVTLSNRHATLLTGYDAAALQGRPFLELVSHADQLPDLQVQLQHVIEGERQSLQHESNLACRDGQQKYIAWYHSRLPLQHHDHRVLSVGLDISERKMAEERLGWLASHDPLTGLFNRRRFSEELEKSVAYSKRYGCSGAVLFFDLDQFKVVNDTSGHGVGDALLVKVAEVLKQQGRASDMIFRLGGDEFAMIARDITQESAGITANRLCEALRAVEVQGQGRKHRASSSIGIALFPDHGEDTDELLANADIAMYEAKQAGRNTWHIYHPDDVDRARLQERVYWLERIKDVVDNNTFHLVFSPIEELATGRVSHYETLLRVPDEAGQLLSTEKFISAAERCGLMQEVDLCVLEKALAFKRQLQQRGDATRIAVNLSGTTLFHAGLYQRVLSLLERYQIHAHELVIELKETTAIEDVGETVARLQDMRQLGVQFALDDFGVGFSSLYHLKQLPVDYVKIDGSFIRQLISQKEDQVLVTAIVEVARVFGLKTIAECVEDEALLPVLSELGVDFVQGYGVGRPQPWEALPGYRGKQTRETRA